jgi:serine/threonine protein kinase
MADSSLLHPGLPPKLEDIISRALEKDRELRYQAAAEMRSELKRLKRDTDSERTLSSGSGAVQELGEEASTRSVEAAQPSAGLARKRNMALAICSALDSPVGGVAQVFLMLTSGGEPLQLTNDESDKSVDGFSPDGKEGCDEVSAVPTLGEAPHRVASGYNATVSSPDGIFIYFAKV